MQVTQRLSNRTGWPGACFESSNAKQFEEVHVVTAKSEFVSKAHEIAVQNLAGDVFSEEQISSITRKLIASQRIYVQESVTIDDTGMHVVINAESVESDIVMWRALEMLADAMYQLDGKQGTITFGEHITFSLSDVPWVIIQ